VELETVEIPRTEARQEYLDYRRQAQLERDPRAARELEEMANAFRLAARQELALIALTPTIRRGGTVTRTLVHRKGRDDERREHYLCPALAVCPADGRFVWTRGVQQDGSIEFSDRLHAPSTYRRGVVQLETGFELPSGFEQGRSLLGNGYGAAWSAMVPIVPPKHRPGNGRFHLGSYLVLWEVDEWTWSVSPPPPGDPALLRHVAGDIYAVLATWDLSPLERLVLSGRSRDEE
jgi:hypothetical protein